MSVPDWIVSVESPHGDHRFGIRVADILSSNDGDVALSVVAAVILEGVKQPYCLDIGAHQGWFSLFCAERCPAAEIHTFEPNPQSYTQLLKNIVAFPQITAHPFAISDFNGELSFIFHEGETHSRDPSGTPIACRRIDSFLKDKSKIHMIKIDTEGHELRILKTMEPYLSNIDTVISEISIYWYGETEDEAVENTFAALKPFLDVYPHIYSLTRRGRPGIYGPLHKDNIKHILSSWYKSHVSTDIVFTKNDKIIQTPLLFQIPSA